MSPSREPRRASNDRRSQDRSDRQHAEDVERATLSTWAVAASESKGRERAEPGDPHRTAFQVDRDRVLRSAAYASLAGKAVALPANRHPSRMQQVSRIAALSGWMARSLGLNVDLTEAIAHASRLGVPPFAEAGMEALGSLIGHPFAVGEQSLRVVERLEGRRGLNLTWEVRDGLVHAPWQQTPAATCEGQVVRVVTRVVESVDAWVHAGRPSVSPSVRRVLGDDPDAMIAALLADSLNVSGTCPEVPGGELLDRYLPELAELVDHARARDEEAATEQERAIHVVSSLVVYEVERAADEDLRRAVDAVCSWSDAEALAAFRDRFQPAG